MIGDLWGAFPRLLEQNIESLLDAAGPNRPRAFMLYKACQYEGLWDQGFEAFSQRLDEFYARPRSARRKSDFDRFLARPMDHHVYQNFHLNFRTADVPERSIDDIASWAHHLMRAARKSSSPVISLEIMAQTLRAIVNPGPLDKAEHITFDDFASTWQKVAFKNFGETADQDIKSVVTELRAINHELQEREKQAARGPSLGLTRAEVEWLGQVRAAADLFEEIPFAPETDAPPKKLLMELDRMISLYSIVQSTKLPELLKHRENIRATILDRCDVLLGVKSIAA